MRVNHISRYRYDQPVIYALQQLRLTPKERAGQKILNWIIDIDGGTRELAFDDQHMNHVDLISVEPGRTEVTITCTGEVDITNSTGIVGGHAGFAPLWYFRRATPLTRSGDGIRAIVAEFADSTDSALDMAHALSARIREQVAYETGMTDSETPAEQALQSGHGVCQDHSHIFLSAARLLGYPARYVSGYLMMNDRVDQDATHAWAEAYVEDIGWVGFDISNGYSPDERYIRVATGLDYRDASPISGMRYGSGGENMDVTVQVQQQQQQQQQ